MKFVVIPET